MIGKTISHYKILEKLGEGGMGVVYKAQDTKLKRSVALKFLPPELTRDKEAKERFIHEAQAASALEHPNICNIHEIDETKDGQMYIVMACYKGEILKDKIERGPLKLEEAVDIAIQIARGLDKAHRKEIVHRDIKPANIFITQDGVVKIVDFGLAKLKGQTRLTKASTTLGTVAYMSPEQARGEEVDHRTDIWSLGVVLYEILTGQLPFRGEYEQAVTYSILNEEHEPVTALRTGIPMELERIINKCLAKKPAKRYQIIEDVIVDLEEIKEKGDVKKKTVSQRIPFKKKNVSLITVIAVVIVMVVLAGVYFFTRKNDVIDSIAVLPLDNLSGDPEQEYFTEGMHEAIISNLNRLGDLRVASRTSAMRYKDTDKLIPEIARELHVDALVEGSVYKVGNQVRITTQLIQGVSDEHLWENTYEGDLTDILSLQKIIARAISEEIGLVLKPDEEASLTAAPQVNPEAYDLYLRGWYFRLKENSEANQKAVDYLEQAVSIDSNFAQAFALLSYLYWRVDESQSKVRTTLERAIELDDHLSDTYVYLGLYRYMSEWDWNGAEQAFKRAIELNLRQINAHYEYGLFLGRAGRTDKALFEMQQVKELDPLFILGDFGFGSVYLHNRQYDKAIEQFTQVLEMDPGNHSVRSHLGYAYALHGMWAEALEQFEKLKFNTGIMMVNYFLGGESEASAYFDSLKVVWEEEGFSSESDLLCYFSIMARRDDKEEALNLLKKLYEEDIELMYLLRTSSVFDFLRAEPRFHALLEKLGQTPLYDQYGRKIR
ncbi:protein kinase [bacterium]|nr:protein kinase [bacterium]